jgi:hypothetical protein
MIFAYIETGSGALIYITGLHACITPGAKANISTNPYGMDRFLGIIQLKDVRYRQHRQNMGEDCPYFT